MADNILERDKFGFTGDRNAIWHGKGKQVRKGLTAVEFFEEIGLDWLTELQPVYCVIGGQQVEIPNTKAHTRKDTGDVLGLVSDSYKPIDNGDLARFADDFGSPVDTAGSLLNGKRVFVLLKLDEQIRVVKHDLVDTYLCLSNGHGGLASFNVYPTSVRVVCNNTLTWSERDLGKGVRFNHMGNVEEKLAQARAILGTATREAQEFAKQVKALANADLSAEQIRTFMLFAYTATFGKAPDQEDQPEAFARWEARKQMVIKDWMERLENERQTLPGIQGTAWAALNAYTEWSDHDRGGAWMESRPADHRIHSNLFGVAAQAKRKVLKAALELV